MILRHALDIRVKEPWAFSCAHYVFPAGKRESFHKAQL